MYEFSLLKSTFPAKIQRGGVVSKGESWYLIPKIGAEVDIRGNPKLKRYPIFLIKSDS